MRFAARVLVLALCAAVPAAADKRLDDAVRKAEAQLAKGKPAEAVKVLQKAASQAPKDPEPPLALARLYLRLGKLGEARAALGQAGERAAAAPPRVRATVLAARAAFALRAGTAGESLAFARQAVEADPAGESLAALARAEARLGLAGARETAERALKAAAAAAASHVASGDALLAARLHAEAEAAYRRALQVDARSVAAGCGLSLSLAGKGDGAAALEAARAAVQSDPQSGEALAAAAIAALAIDPGDRKSEAAVSAHQAAALEPTSPFVKLVAGRVAQSRGQSAEAAAAYAEATALDPTWPAPRIAALALRLQEGADEAALAELRALPPEVQASGEGQLLLGRLLSRKEEWPAALSALDRAADALPGLADAHALRAVAAYNAGELKLAVEGASRAAALAPSDSTLLSRHALYLSYDRQMEAAVAAMQQALALPGGETPEALMALGEIYAGMRPPRVADAVAAYEKAFKLDAKNPRPLFGIAESHRAAQQWTRAISAYERVSQAFPRLDGQASLGTAWCYLLSGDTTRARFYTGEAVRGGADVGEIREALSAGGASAGALAQAELVQALRSKNAGVQARAARELLERGRAGVPALAAALGRKGTALPVRELIVEGLATLGPAARDALVQLDRIARAGPVDQGGQAADEQQALAEREAKLSASARAAGEKIRAGTP